MYIIFLVLDGKLQLILFFYFIFQTHLITIFESHQVLIDFLFLLCIKTLFYYNIKFNKIFIYLITILLIAG